MVRTTAKDIAKYFQESVSFDFDRESISSFQQIESASDEFYTLIDKEAFSALLNDFLGYDNQLKDIFIDVFDSELGIHCFANKGARNSPRSRVSYFLNKYTYHQNDIAKVYLVFNTWLEFFGCGSLSPDWVKCPFCGGSVKAIGTNTTGVKCTNKSCMKTTSDFMSAASELAILLADEQSGRATPTPKYWDAIKERSEFYTEYKLPIEKLRSTRVHEEQLKAEKKKTEIVESAVKELNRIGALLELEADKQSPDFDSILKLVAQNAQINEANKYNDPAFSKKVSSLSDQIAKKKAELKKTRAEAQNAMEFAANVLKFLELQSLLEQELVSKSKPLEEFKSVFEDLDNKYNRISAGKKSGYSIDNQKQIEAINKYETNLRSQLLDYLSQVEHSSLISKKQSELITKVNLILNRFYGVQAKDDKSAQIAKAFNDEIEMNHYFDDYRVECRTKYLEITNSVRTELAKLIKNENEVKLAEFKTEAGKFISELNSAQPNLLRSGVFKNRLSTIRTTNYYDSIRTNGEYIKNINAIIEKINILENEEKAYSAGLEASRVARQKRRRHIKNTFVALVIVLVLSSLAFAVCELGGLLPTSIVFSKVSSDLSGEVVDGRIVLSSSEALDEKLIIPETARLNWQFKEHKIVKIGDYAFSNSSTIEIVELPKTISEIGSSAFSSCPKLRRIILTSYIPPRIDETSFANSNATFYVPKDNYEAYLQNEMWAQYSERIFPNIVNSLDRGMIILDSKGGDHLDAIGDQPINSTLETLPVPNKDGHVFSGWFYDINGETKMFELNQTLFTESIKLYAKWDYRDYTISFDYQGGDGDKSDKTVTYDFEYGELPIATKNGYTFLGWHIGDDLITDSSKVEILSNTTLVAKWAPNKYNVNFDYMGGETVIADKEVAFESAYGELPIAERNGYLFLGWYINDNLITDTTTVDISEDHTLAAKWQPIQYKVVYVLNGGFLDCSEFTYDYDEELTLAVPSKDGYSFNCWICNGVKYYAGTATSNLSGIDGDVLEFTAVWDANINQIVYDSNGGVGIMDSTDLETGAIFNLPNNVFAREGYEFKGWSTSLNGEVEYLNEASYTMSTKATNILYAIWEAKVNKITLNYVIGTEILESRELMVRTDDVVVLDNTFVRNGYTMAGWCIVMGGDLIYEVDSQYIMFPADLVLYTVWLPDSDADYYEVRDGNENSLFVVDEKTVKCK